MDNVPQVWIDYLKAWINMEWKVPKKTGNWEVYARVPHVEKIWRVQERKNTGIQNKKKKSVKQTVHLPEWLSEFKNSP